MAQQNKTIRVDPEWWERLTAYAAAQGLYPSRVMIQAAEREMQAAGHAPDEATGVQTALPRSYSRRS